VQRAGIRLKATWLSSPAGLYHERFELPSLHWVVQVQDFVNLNLSTTLEEIQVLDSSVILLDAHREVSWRVQTQLDRLVLLLDAREYAQLIAAMPTSALAHDPILPNFSEIFQAQGQTRTERDFIQPFCETLLAHLARAGKSANLDDSGQDALKLLREFVDQRLGYDLSVEDMAKHLALSKFQLLRVMKKEGDATPQQFLISRRIERAKSLLKKSDASLVDIALQTGFSSQSHLSNTFKQIVGATPKGYREGDLGDG
jgi:AraC-like DNA-binding protein